MDFAKPCFDIGLSTNNLEDMLTFWQQQVGTPFDHMLPLGGGRRQHRHDAHGSVIKINHHRDPIKPNPPTGYLEVLIASDSVTGRTPLTDPDGNLVTLVPKGEGGITQMALRMGVRDVAKHSAFYRDAFALEEVTYAGGAGFQVGNGLLLIEHDANAPTDADMDGPGYRYITLQVFNADEAHQMALANGGVEAMAPTTLGETARISMVKDPDGNWIELSQRASLVGSLE